MFTGVHVGWSVYWKRWLEKMDDEWEVIHTNSADSVSNTDEPCESSRIKNDGCANHIEERNDSEVEGGNTRVPVDSNATMGWHDNACENEDTPPACHCNNKNV